MKPRHKHTQLPKFFKHNNMKKNLLFSLFFLLLAAVGQSQGTVTITGLVSSALNGVPVPDHEVYCITGDSINFVVEVAITNPDGTYSANLNLPPGFSTVFVSTETRCDPNNPFSQHILDVANGQTVANFEVCADTFPPFPECFANFYAELVDSLTFQFNGYYYGLDSNAVAVSYLWDFGDGTTSTDASPVHTYAQDGLYWVTLTITGSDGCVSTATYPFETSFQGFPDCMGYILYNQIDSLTYDFSAEIYDANGNQVQASTYLWDFGDGATSTDASVTHTYAQTGVYTVQLHATTADGCEIHTCEVIFPFNGPVDTFWYGCQAMFATGYFIDSTGNPGGGFDPNGNPLDPLTVSFIDLSLGAVTSWAWSFGDGSTSTEQNPTHTYAQNGLYVVSLSITTLDGCESEIAFEICAGDSCWFPEYDCQAMYIPVPDSLGGNGIQFLDVSYTVSPIQSWTWSFGDGTSSNEQNPYHVYTQPGTYTVSLTIVADSCNSVISMEFNTEDPWNFNRGGEVAQLGVSGSTLATKDPMKAFEKLKLFPNPAKDEVSLAFSSKDAREYEIRVTDISGKTISITRQNANAGVNAVRVNVSNLTPGLYFAEIRSAESVQTLKFVKE
jgi:PKD repeat protein